MGTMLDVCLALTGSSVGFQPIGDMSEELEKSVFQEIGPFAMSLGMIMSVKPASRFPCHRSHNRVFDRIEGASNSLGRRIGKSHGVEGVLQTLW